jgi:hypothetical protein
MLSPDTKGKFIFPGASEVRTCCCGMEKETSHTREKSTGPLLDLILKVAIVNRYLKVI